MQILSLFQSIRSSRLLNDSFWSLLGNVVLRGMSLAAGIVIARFLGKEIFGEYGIIKNTILAISVFSTFGLGYTGTKFVAEYKNNKPEYIRTVLSYINRITLVFSGFLMLILFFMADFIAKTVLSAPHLNISLRILSILIIFNALTTTQIGVLAGFGKFKELARVNAIIGIVTFITSLFLTYFFKLNGALASLLLTQILNCILNIRLIRKSFPNNKNTTILDQGLLKEILKFSTPVAMQEAIYWAMHWINNILIIKFATYGELGLLTAAIQWNAVILFIPGILRNVILTHLSETNKDEIKHSRILKITLIINASVTIISAIVVFLFSSFISGMYGSTFEGLKNLITIAVFTTIFASMSNVYAQAYLSKGKTWMMFYIRLIRDVGIVFLFLVLIKAEFFSAAESMIYSSLIMNIIFLIIMMIVYDKKLRKQYSVKNI